MKNNTFNNLLCQGASNVLSKDIPKSKSFADTTPELNLQTFGVGGLGNFPYYWQDPFNLSFNSDTYNWISANLKAGVNPIAQASGSTFTNLYIDVLSKISYSLSPTSTTELTDASNNIITQQQNLLRIWVSVYGSASIDSLINTIINTWTSPPITLLDLQNSNNLTTDLNQVPVSGMPILPILTNYIDALNKSTSLINASSSNSGYLSAALAALQTPNRTNGGILLSDNSVQPAYVITTPLQDILNGLKNTSNTNTIEVTIDRVNDNVISVEVPGQPAFNIHPNDFLKMSVNSDSDLFSTILKKSIGPVKLDLSFSGVTMVYFQPVAFNKSNNENWFWTQPVIDAIKNGSTGVTGFKFLPKPNIDFSEEGPYGFLTGVAISNSPTIDLKVCSTDYQTIANSIQDSDTVELELLGCAIENESQVSNLTKSVNTDSSTNSVLVSLSPQSVAAPSVNSRAWVHGVQVEFPAAMK
ncbi:MAG: hypothetical protein COA88_11570 [Kordia sp.]|nr:MAG: hypothetical protein COA88_11570 [Kordia sp.]